MKTLLIATALIAQTAQPPSPPPAPPPTAEPHAPGIIGAPAGTGRSPAIAEVAARLPDHTVYRPAQLPTARLPIVVWGNGGCRDNGLSASHFLREVASHGYFVVAAGHARSERAAGPPPKLVPVPATPAVFKGPSSPAPDETTTAQVIGGLDWALTENARKGSPLYRRLNPTRVAVMGHSCGGLQAIEASADPRIKTSVIWSSGVYDRTGIAPKVGIAIDKTAIAKFHAPVAYINGGPSDIAFSAALDDFSRIERVPAFFGWTSIGHGGTFATENGGEYGRIGVAWLNWQLRGDRRAGRMFTGKDCSLCVAPNWTVRRKRID